MLDIRSYDLMNRESKIGEFIEDWSGKNYYFVKFKIVLNDDLDLNDFRYTDLKVLQSNKVISNKHSMFWVKNRLYVSPQLGINFNLEIQGLTTKQILSMLHKNSGVRYTDDYWIKFNPYFEFNKNHVRGDNFTKIIGMLDGKLVE